MAGPERMTVEEVVRRVLCDGHADVIRESVRAIAREIMEVEVAELIGEDKPPYGRPPAVPADAGY